jgi:hypothetical protein
MMTLLLPTFLDVSAFSSSPASRPSMAATIPSVSGFATRDPSSSMALATFSKWTLDAWRHAAKMAKTVCFSASEYCSVP